LGIQPRVAAHSGAFWAVIVSLLLTVLGIGSGRGLTHLVSHGG